MGIWVTKINGDTVAATEWNPIGDEMENLQTAGSETASASTDQMAKAVTSIVANADYYTDGGVADAYILSAISPNIAPQSYRNGMRVRFRTANANTGASTVNVASLGSKNIKKQDGSSDPDAGDISTARENILAYDGTNFRLTTELNDATEILKGIIELATQAETNTGTDNVRAITPLKYTQAHQTCKAWVQFDGSNGAISDAFNVSGVVRNSAGNYTVSFTNNMPDTNYCVVLGCRSDTEKGTPNYHTKAVGSVVILNRLTTVYTSTDLSLCSVAIFSTF